MLVPAFIGGIGPWELGLVLVIVLLLFGAGKLPQVFEQFGKAVKKFRDAQREEALDVSPEARKADQLADHGEVERAAEVERASEVEELKHRTN